MIKEIVTYPTPMSLEYGIDVRVFDEKLFALIEDLKDTLKANNLEGIAAYQIGNYHNVIVIKNENGDLLELINPRIIKHKNQTIEEETTAYFPNLSAKVARYNEISLIYQDRNGNNQTLHVNGKIARIIQRKVDYTFGANFVTKLSPEEQKEFEQNLSGGIDTAISKGCPRVLVRDILKKLSDYLKIAMVLLLITALFVSDEVRSTLWNIQLLSSLGVIGLDIAYFFYAIHEAKIYKQCTSCQIGSFTGIVAISLTRLTIIMLVSYYFM